MPDKLTPVDKLIDGGVLAEQVKSEVAVRVKALAARGVTPGLSVVLVGDDPASAVYVGSKERTCIELGMKGETIRRPATITQDELLEIVDRLNDDPTVHGILVQMPLPKHMDAEAVVRRIRADKDVDGFHPVNVGKLLIGERDGFAPCTPAGVLHLLQAYGIPTAGADCVIVGRSNIVGKPMAALMVQAGVDATVTVCHSRTRDLGSHTRRADILIVAAGRAEMISADMVKPGAVVIDVGMNRIADATKKSGTRLVGDVAFGPVREIASAITPVPGGVGKMTIAMLMANTVRAAEQQLLVTARRGSRRPAQADPDLFGETDAFAAESASAPIRARREEREERIAEPELEPVYDGGAYPGETAATAVSVSILTQTARDVIEGAFIPLWVRGEITDFKSHRNGHWYFCLRDGTSQIRCVVWKRDRRGIPAAPDDGMQVAAFGRLTVYPARGEMQYGVVRIEAEGDGLRRKALEITRGRLEADGLLALERKRPLPRFPRVIAVVTSPDGAALHDIVAVLRRRWANVRIVVVPAAVQGENAPGELVAALDRVNRWGGADLVIVGRGGGSREDLWAFNDERVARAVANCHAPTISAVGHEIDISICDLVADHRAPTPSAAAEAATVSRGELTGELRELASRITNATIDSVRWQTDRLKHARRDLAAAGVGQVARRQSALESVAGRLHALSPLATLARGYSVARDAHGATLAATSAFREGMPFNLIVRDGTVPAVVVGTPTEIVP